MSLPQQIIERIHQAQNGPLSEHEVAELATIYAASGVQLNFGERPTADIASTGGPSSLSTLLAPLFLTTFGYGVPKLAVPGRPAGGLDVLAQLRGYSIDLQPQQIEAIIESCGYAHFISSGLYAPLDAETFTYRQAVGAQQAPDLVIASLLSKKLAVNVKHVGLDVRVARHGNFGGSLSTARSNSLKFIRVADLLGLRAVCVLSDVTQPLQPFIGRGEALWALERFFSGSADDWLLDHVDRISLMVGSLADSETKIGAASLRSGFFANLAAQGANQTSFQEAVQLVSTSHNRVVHARQDGFVSYDLAKMRDVIVAAQMSHAGADRFPDPLGARLLVRPGAFVESGDPIMTIRATSDVWDSSRTALHECAICSDDATASTKDEVVDAK